MDANEFDGKDLDDALAAASVALGRPASEIDYELLEGGRKGVFGLGARPVRIRAASAGSPPPAPGVPPPPAKPVAKQAAAPTAKPAAASTVVSGPGTALAGIIANMNPIPSDAADLKVMSGLRFGVSASTTRGFGVAEFETVGDLIAEVLASLRNGADNTAVEQSVLARVHALTRRFPIYES
jgi:hypothetical protein